MSKVKDSQLSLSQRKNLTQAKSYCSDKQINKIIKEYKQLSNSFTQLLANKYPFASVKSAASLSPKTLKIFIARYPGSISGLAQRMKVLSWLKPEYKTAYNFIMELDQSIEFLIETLNVSEASSGAGIGMTFDFNVISERALYGNHFIQWQLKLGENYINYPGEKSSLLWLPGDLSQLTLHAASNSPYQFTAVNGYTSANQLSYKEEGFWSIIKFVQKYRDNVPDTKTLFTESIVLGFKSKAKLRELSKERSQKEHSQKEPEVNSVFLGVTFFRSDSESKKMVSIKFPKKFPEFAPGIK